MGVKTRVDSARGPLAGRAVQASGPGCVLRSAGGAAVIGPDRVVRRYEDGGAALSVPPKVSSGGAYGATVRDRGTGSETGWAGRCYAVGCEPGLLDGRPCDLPGCAESADP